jgi:hypothetical protein
MMSHDSLAPLFGTVSRLLVQAEHGPELAERTEAVKQLKAIKADLKLGLREAEAGQQAGMKFAVEIAARRAMLAALAQELAKIEAAEFVRTPSLRRAVTA